MNYFEAASIRLRAPEPGDVGFLHAWNQHSEMTRNLDWIWFPRSRAHIERFITAANEKKEDDDDFFFIIETLDGVTVGMINAHDTDRRIGCFEYGVAVHPEHQRRGYAREAIGLLLRYYFDELRYQKCTAHIADFNDASVTLHQDLGFQPEGRFRRIWFTGGQYHDELIYGLTIEEYRTTHP